MFTAIASAWDIDTALYPGCYLDLSPSAVIRSVTYLDIDSRAARYFADTERHNGRGISYTRPAFAYLFRRSEKPRAESRTE